MYILAHFYNKMFYIIHDSNVLYRARLGITLHLVFPLSVPRKPKGRCTVPTSVSDFVLFKVSDPESNCLGFMVVPGHTKDSNEVKEIPNS